MPEANGNAPATRADVRALETKMEGRLQQLEDKMDRRFADSEDRIAQIIKESNNQLRDEMQEFVRDAQTELLRGFEAFAGGFEVRFRKVTADLSNMSSATDLRLTILERRMTEIEKTASLASAAVGKGIDKLNCFPPRRAMAESDSRNR